MNINNNVVKYISVVVTIAFLSACTSSRPYTPTVAETAAAARSVDAINSAPNYQTQVPSIPTVPSKPSVNDSLAASTPVIIFLLVFILRSALRRSWRVSR